LSRSLVHRASLFWRLRRATSIETGLLRMQSEILHAFRSSHQNTPKPSAGEGGPRAVAGTGAQIGRDEVGVGSTQPLSGIELRYLKQLRWKEPHNYAMQSGTTCRRRRCRLISGGVYGAQESQQHGEICYVVVEPFSGLVGRLISMLCIAVRPRKPVAFELRG